MSQSSLALKDTFGALHTAKAYDPLTDAARARILGGVDVDVNVAGIDVINHATQELVRLDNMGRRLDLEIQDVPYDALMKIADGFRDFGLSNALASPLVEAIENYALHLGTDFTRKANPTPLKIHLYITDKKPELSDESTHFMVAFDGQSMFGGEFSKMNVGFGINGTTSSQSNLPDIDKMFQSGKTKYLIFHYETLTPDTLQGLDEVATNLTNLAQAAGPSASGESLRQVRQSIENSSIAPVQSELIANVAQLNHAIESARSTAKTTAEIAPVVTQLKAKIETMIQAAPKAQIPAVLVEAAKQSIQRPEVKAAAPKIMTAETVNTYAQTPKVEVPKAGNENKANVVKTPTVADAVAAAPVQKTPVQPVQQAAPVVKEVAKPAAQVQAATVTMTQKVQAPATPVAAQPAKQIQAPKPVDAAPVQARPAMQAQAAQPAAVQNRPVFQPAPSAPAAQSVATATVALQRAPSIAPQPVKQTIAAPVETRVQAQPAPQQRQAVQPAPQPAPVVNKAPPASQPAKPEPVTVRPPEPPKPQPPQQKNEPVKPVATVTPKPVDVAGNPTKPPVKPVEVLVKPDPVVTSHQEKPHRGDAPPQPDRIPLINPRPNFADVKLITPGFKPERETFFVDAAPGKAPTVDRVEHRRPETMDLPRNISSFKPDSGSAPRSFGFSTGDAPKFGGGGSDGGHFSRPERMVESNRLDVSFEKPANLKVPSPKSIKGTFKSNCTGKKDTCPPTCGGNLCGFTMEMA